MTYRAMLVHVPLDEAQNQVELAAHLAKEFGAHLTGVCSLPEVAILRSAGRNAFVKLEAGQIEELIRQEYAEAAAAKQTFDKIATSAGVAHHWLTGWRGG